MAFFLPFSSLALTSQTTRNAIQGSAPYLTFDGGRNRAVNINALLWIKLSDGTKYTPSTNSSSYNYPIELPVTGQSFTDISMLVPTDTNSVALNTLIGPPYNYWRDDDGDGDILVDGTLSLSILDKNNQAVSRNAVLEIARAPYKVILTSTNGKLMTRYGVPKNGYFSASNVTYYINPKERPVILFAKPNLSYGSGSYAGPSSMWNPKRGFLTQSTEQSSYDLNFPTTGADGLYFDLAISGNSKALYWQPVSREGITATMSNSTNTGVRVTLKGPVVTDSSQHWSENPRRIYRPSLPQTFELIGRDRKGNSVVKYGFKLKQWFVNRGQAQFDYSHTVSWCNRIGYSMPRVVDLTNSTYERGANFPSSGNYYQRRIGAGFFTEWGALEDGYYKAEFLSNWYWSRGSEIVRVVKPRDGVVFYHYTDNRFYGLCVYP